MKKVFTLTLLFYAINCAAQTKMSMAEFSKNPRFDKKGTIVINKFLNKFIGNWHWQSDGRELTITFIKETLSSNFNNGRVTIDVIKGKYIYVEDKERFNTESNDYLVAGSTSTATSPLAFKVENKQLGKVALGHDMFLEFVYVDKNTLHFRISSGTPASVKAKINLPFDILLKRSR